MAEEDIKIKVGYAHYLIQVTTATATQRGLLTNVAAPSPLHDLRQIDTQSSF